MSEEHPPFLIETQTHWLQHVQCINLTEVAGYVTENFGYAHTLRGVRFRFGYAIMPAAIGNEIHNCFQFAINCEAHVRDNDWICPAAFDFWIYTVENENGHHRENVYHHKKEVKVAFNKDVQLYHFTCAKLKTQDLLQHFSDRPFMFRIGIVVDPPSGVYNCLPFNASLLFGKDRTLAVNKELLCAHSDEFKRLFERMPIDVQQNLWNADTEAIEHFKIIYEILEKGSSSELYDETVSGVLRLANKFTLYNVESVCATWINGRKCKLPLPDKFLAYKNIGATTSQWNTVKRATKAEIGANPARYTRMLTAAKFLNYDEIEEMATIADDVLF